MKAPYFSQPNLLAGRQVVPELLQGDVTPQRLGEELLHWLDHPAECSALARRFTEIHRQLRRDASERAAQAVLRLLGEEGSTRGQTPEGRLQGQTPGRGRARSLTPLGSDSSEPLAMAPRFQRKMSPDPAILVAGVDEAGRGPLAGPVFAAAVVLDPAQPIEGLRDSKRLAPATRERLAPVIRDRSLAFGIGSADAAEVDALNIAGATWLAMRRALLALPLRPRLVLVDGNRLPPRGLLGFACRWRAEVRGDDRIPAISAASILAKTARDAWMREAALAYPGYGFEAHKGYPTSQHLQALARLGPCGLHRRSFGPVKSSATPA